MKQQREKWIYTTDVAVTAAYDTQRFILLIRRAKDPFEGKLALPGGHVETKDCGSAKAAIRELKEETGLDIPVHLLELFAVLDEPNRDPRGPTVSAVYRLNVMPKMLEFAKADSDAAEIVIRELSTLEPEEMAFDHYEVIEMLRTKGVRR
jgi:8-oxo-dGTP diphosphatase